MTSKPTSRNAASGEHLMLSVLLDGMADIAPVHDRRVSGVHLDSRQVVAGDLFIALQGDTVHGLDFLQAVIGNKASAVLVSSGDPRCGDGERSALLSASISLIEIDNLASLTGEIASRFFGNPSSAMSMVGVTGTDGKTSVCHLLGQALNANNNVCGVLGTLGWGFGDKLQSTGLTTPDAVVLQSALAEIFNAGAKTVAMEVSSHALSQQRVNGIAFDIAVLTNIGRDHLDYHGDMQSYRDAKKTLFYKPQLRSAVINADDQFGEQLLDQLPELDLYSYGAAVRKGNHIQYLNVKHLTSGLSFDLEFDGKSYPVVSGLIGGFNVQNLVATFAVLVALGVSPELAVASLSELKPVPGRMEATLLDNGAVVIVDYAHNPHALESVLHTVSTHCDGKLLVVFGCGGDRDQGKRPMMASVAEEFSDVCIVTDDNPRSESGDAIVEQIVAGFKSRQNITIERDRKSAIEFAMSQAASGDFVVVAGKGHEDYQLIGDKRLPFSDSAVVASYAETMA